jgi:hypothetical protein
MLLEACVRVCGLLCLGGRLVWLLTSLLSLLDRLLPSWMVQEAELGGDVELLPGDECKNVEEVLVIAVGKGALLRLTLTADGLDE